MPSTRRKSPLSTGKRMSLFSTLVRNVIKQRKNKPEKTSTDSDGSYLQVGSDQAPVSASNKDSSQHAPAAAAPDTNQAILTVLNCLEVTNQDLS